MSVRRILPFALAGLAALCLIALLPTAAASPWDTTHYGSETGSASPSVQAFHFVDSAATGCLSPSAIAAGGVPAKGCPGGWVEIANSGNVYNKYYMPYNGADYGQQSQYMYSGPPCSGCYYATTSFFTNSPTAYASYNWYPHENGFLHFGNYGVYCGGANPNTRTPVQLPATTTASGCSTAAGGHPENIVAGFWTNLQPNFYYGGTFYGGPGICWDEPPAPVGFPGGGEGPGSVWFNPYAIGTSPNSYAVIEFDRVLVNPSDGGCNVGPVPNHYASFEYKIYDTGSGAASPLMGDIEVVYKDVDHGTQAYSLGIANTVGNAGINYCSPTADCSATSPATHLTDFAVRYFPQHGAAALPGTVTINEDCAAPSAINIGLACSAVSPSNFVGSPDYNGVVPPGAKYCISTAPTRGTFAPAPSCIGATCPVSGSAAYGTTPPAYSPYTNYNGIPPGPPNPPDSYKYCVQDGGAAGLVSGPAQVSISVLPVNDAPSPIAHAYNVLSDDSIFVPASNGVTIGATDPELPLQRSGWGCLAGYPSCPAGSMTEASPPETMYAAMTACPGYSSAWNPLHGTVTYVDPSGTSVTGVHPYGSFTYTTAGYTGTDSFQFCLYDGLYSAPQTVTLNIAPGTVGYNAKADGYVMNEDTGPLVAEGAARPAANDDAALCPSGLQFQLIPGSGPSGAAAFIWDSATGSFDYTPLGNWAGDDLFKYQMNCPSLPPGSQLSNIAIVHIVVVQVNDPPTFTTWMNSGDVINEDNGIVGPTTPPPFTRSVPNFMTNIGPGPGADELTFQTVRAVIVSQSNTGLFNSVVPCPANFDFAVTAASCPTTKGPALTLSGAAGSQVLTLTYTTKPDANGIDTICFRLMDNGGTYVGGQNQNPMPPAAALCFDINIIAIPDVPRAGADSYAIYQGHELYAPAPSATLPGPTTATDGGPWAGLLANDVEVDGETPLTAVLSTSPALGKLSYLTADGTFHYTPPTSMPRVTAITPNVGAATSLLPAPRIIGSEKYRDLDGSASFTPGDALYISGSTRPVANDIRLTANGAFPAGSTVLAGDSDTLVTTPLLATPPAHMFTCYFDANGNAVFDAADPIYLQVAACGPGSTAPGDLRLSDGGAAPGGTLIQAADSDRGAKTVALAAKYCFLDQAPAGYSTGDPVYLHVGACGSGLAVGDIRFAPATGVVTFTYVARDTGGAISPATTVTINILPNAKPTGTFDSSAFTAGATNPTAGAFVSFTSACSDPDVGDTSRIIFSWDFGDGFASSMQNPVHAYKSPGVYTVALTCYDPHGDSVRLTHGLVISDAGTTDQVPADDQTEAPATAAPLVAYAGGDQVILEGASVAMLGSSIPDGATVWQWTQVSGPKVTLKNAGLPNPSFDAPKLTGNNKVDLVFQLVVGDGARESLPSLIHITVAGGNHPPVSKPGATQFVHEGDLVTLDGSASFDPDSGDTVTYHWISVTDLNVKLIGADTPKATFTVPAGSLGHSLVFSLEVSDGTATTVDSMTVQVTATVFTGPGFSTELTPDGKVTVTPIVDAATYVWDFGDAAAPVASTGVATHTYTARGEYTIRLQAQDATGALLSFEQVVPVTFPADNATRPAVVTGTQNASNAAWLLGAGAVLLTAGLVALAVWVNRRQR